MAQVSFWPLLFTIPITQVTVSIQYTLLNPSFPNRIEWLIVFTVHYENISLTTVCFPSVPTAVYLSLRLDYYSLGSGVVHR